MEASAYCRKAAELVSGDRAGQHGDMLACHENIAALWSAWLGREITAHDVAVMMVLLKVGRMKTGAHNQDNAIDAAGYSGIAGYLADLARES